MSFKLKPNFQLINENSLAGSLSDFSFFDAKNNPYDIDILDDYISNEEKQRINGFDSHYSYYSDVKKLFEFEPIKLNLSHPKASNKNPTEKSKNGIAKPKLKLPTIKSNNSSKLNRLFEKYQSSNRKNESINLEQVNQNDLIKNILSYDIYDGRKSTKYEDLTSSLKKPNSPLFENASPNYTTPRSTPVFCSNENPHSTHDGYESVKSDDQLLPAITFRERYPIYYNFSPAVSSDYFIKDKQTIYSYGETSFNSFKSRLPTKTKVKKS